MYANNNSIDASITKLIKAKARQMIGTTRFRWSDYNDIVQELTLDVLIRLSKFDPAKLSRRAFVSSILDHKIANLIREQQRQKRNPCREAFSLNEPTRSEDGGKAERGDCLTEDVVRIGARRSAEDALNLKIDMDIVISNLSEDLRGMASQLKTGSISETAKNLGVSRAHVAKSVEKLREVFIQAKLHKYIHNANQNAPARGIKISRGTLEKKGQK